MSNGRIIGLVNGLTFGHIFGTAFINSSGAQLVTVVICTVVFAVTQWMIFQAVNRNVTHPHPGRKCEK